MPPLFLLTALAARGGLRIWPYVDHDVVRGDVSFRARLEAASAAIAPQVSSWTGISGAIQANRQGTIEQPQTERLYSGSQRRSSRAVTSRKLRRSHLEKKTSSAAVGHSLTHRP